MNHNTPTARPRRRYDPGRRERLIEAALDVIAESGVAGTTHRRIAAAADVPLGSMTYHFDGIDEVLALAFTRLADTVADQFDARMASATDRTGAADAVVDLIATDLLGSSRDLVLSYELYTAAVRNPALRHVTQGWMERSRRALERHFDPATARALDALIEGLVLHSALSTAPMTTEEIRAAVHRMTR
jgi:DNA-binding transcriptional regulator YbjK